MGRAAPWATPIDHLLTCLTGTGFPVPSTDHRLVWLDVRVPGA